jgi:hypothetical protein
MLSLIVITTQAEEDDPPLDDKFVAALVMMSINHNMMEGEDELADLSALHDFVEDYYDGRIASVQDSTSADWLHLQKRLLTSVIAEEIEIKSGSNLLHLFLAIFSDEEAINITREQFGLRRLVSGRTNPPEDYFDTMNSLVITDIEAQVNVLLDIDTITVQPALAPAINDSTPWTYNLPAITDSTSSITPDIDQEPAPTASSTDKDDPVSGISQPVSKPLRFTNNGFEPVTVVVESYTPAPGYSPAKPMSSTVVSPESGTSAFLDLPLGTYTFCYYWELDADYDNDGDIDYHHRTTSSISLNNNSSDNPDMALSVTLNPDSIVSNPNGRCGEEMVEMGSDLTPEEEANAGTNEYLVSCQDIDWCEGETSLETLIITFSPGSVNILNTGEGEAQVFTQLGRNRYSWTNSYGDDFILTFTMEGFLYAMDSGGVFVFTRQ